jgi:hypothetical protein
MTEEFTIGIALTTSVLIAGGGYLIYKYKKKKELAEINKVRPYSYGDTTMFMRNHEIAHFESIGRKEKRKIISRFNARVSRGEIVPVYDGKAIIGYVPKTK